MQWSKVSLSSYSQCKKSCFPLTLVKNHTFFLQTQSIFWSITIKQNKHVHLPKLSGDDRYGGQGAEWLFDLKHPDLLLNCTLTLMVRGLISALGYFSFLCTQNIILAIIKLHTFPPYFTWVTPKCLFMAVCGAHADAPGLKAQQASTAPWAAEQSRHFKQPATNQEDAQVL